MTARGGQLWAAVADELARWDAPPATATPITDYYDLVDQVRLSYEEAAQRALDDWARWELFRAKATKARPVARRAALRAVGLEARALDLEEISRRCWEQTKG